MVATLQDKARKKKLALGCLIRYDVPELVQGDAGRVRQVLSNLLDNAVKFTAEGEILVRAHREREEADRVTVRFEVRDSGPGSRPRASASCSCRSRRWTARRAGATAAPAWASPSRGGWSS